MNTTLFNFKKDTDISKWQVVDDVVMGGRSSGSFKLNKDGNGEFSGHISLENNGGFSSLQYNLPTTFVNPEQSVELYLKGDGKDYQFRVKDKISNSHSYVYTFKTTGDWQVVKIQLSQMTPQFRGRKLQMNAFDQNQIEQLTFLIGNKKKEDFKLELDKIVLVH
ncbi:CIA30 family protein [Leeuwenhoekiella sp. NPDC079379]|uniref:CIA30 family protein n=1 Tax=Leeuwenhoekiella sp. NPDC079379 TaxID=3364122 RepID=UPI0037CB6DE1